MTLDIWVALKSIFLLFIITDPLGNFPIFLHAMKNIKKEKRMSAINHAFITVVVVLTLFALFGNSIFEFFNVSYQSFLIAGGVLLFFVAVSMIKGNKESLSGNPKSFGVVPLGIPLVAGPGAMTMTVLLSETFGKLIAILSILAAGGLMWFTFKYADRLMELIGENGSDTVTRVMGIILGVISVQFVITGLQAVF
ncbi:MAG: MarC family protein [Candidatus Aenigmarchaeota archaeon]|nr:MarC family protein [Candidatus Aenigmarchaeota archaeon]